MSTKNFEISFRVIPHADQRYNTVGDYLTDDDGVTKVIVSDMGDWRYEYLIAYHEMTEIALCRRDGITDQMIDEFDLWFEKHKGSASEYVEPGDDEGSPYHQQHLVATKMERIMADHLEVDWNVYEATIARLMLDRANQSA